MAEPETRFVNRCIYSPIENRPDIGDDMPGFVAKQPFLRLAVLQSVLDTPELGEFLLGEMGSGVIDPAGALSGAARHAWAGNFRDAAALVNSVELSDLHAFASHALDTHERVATAAASDLDHAISEVATSKGNGHGASRPSAVPVDELVGTVRRAVSEELHARLEPLVHSGAPARPLHGAGDAARARVGARPDTAVTQPSARTEPAHIRSAVAAVAAVNQDEVHRFLLRHNGGTSARYLALERFFPRTTPVLGAALGELGRSLTFTVRQRLELERKRAVLQGLDLLASIEPVGYLHLERMHFTPVGYVRGELVYSLPMTPGEVTRVTHREWTRTETDYTTLVATSLETATQDSLSEKSELTESVSTQQQHTSAFNSSVTASGGFGPVQISTSVGYNAANAATKTASQSQSHAQEITKTASSRAKQEHKMTFRVTTVHEVEDLSYREISNPTDQPVRWDFFRLMQKWQIDLYRYDVRMTYDVVVPEPGSYLLLRHLRLRELNRKIDQEFALEAAADVGWDGHPSGITPDNYQDLAKAFTVALDTPPDPLKPVSAHAETTFSNKLVGYDYVELSLPQGYQFLTDGWTAIPAETFRVHDDGDVHSGRILTYESQNLALIRQGAFEGSAYQWLYGYDWSENAEAEQGSVMSIAVYAYGVPTAATMQAWQNQCYGRIVDAAKAGFEASRQRLISIRDRLQAEIDRDDDLALRKLEREEIMKSVLRWVLGRKFEFYPDALPDLDLKVGHDLAYYDGDGLVKADFLKDGTSEGQYAAAMATHGETIRFLHHAIEWENVNYVLYPYFWTDRPRWYFKETFFHPDYQHRSFLRAGAARVVLTIRPGFEKAFLSFMETGDLDGLDAQAPYIRVAEELKQAAETNYPYTPSANEERPENRVDTWMEYTPTGALDIALGTTLDA